MESATGVETKNDSMQPGKSLCVSCGRFAKIDDAQTCFWCNNKKRMLGRSIPGRKRHNDAFTAAGKPRFVSVGQLHQDTLSLIGQIPPDVVAIVGVARSGMVVATMLSMMLHKPLFAIRQTKGDVIAVGNGWRLGGSNHVSPPTGRVLVVDDHRVELLSGGVALLVDRGGGRDGHGHSVHETGSW